MEALRLSDALLKDNPRSPAVWTARGYALEGLGRDKESIVSFQRALSFAPSFIPALKGAAEAAYRSKDTHARDFVDELLQLEPENATAQGMAGVLAYEAGNCPVAIQHFEKSRAETQHNEQAFSLYGICLVTEHRASDAEAVFQQLLTERPDSAKTLNLLAWAEGSNGHPQSAMDHLREAIAIDPKNEQNYVDLTSLCIQYGTWEAAREIVDASLRNDPASPRLHALRGVIDAQFGQYDDATAEFDRANDLDPSNQFGAAGLGVLYTERNQPASAVAAVRSRLKKTPDDPTLNYFLADALIREGPDDAAAMAEARRALQTAVRTKPDFEQAHALLGKLYVQHGDYESGIKELLRALKQNQQNRMALNQLVIAYRHLGQSNEAAEALSELKQAVENKRH